MEHIQLQVSGFRSQVSALDFSFHAVDGLAEEVVWDAGRYGVEWDALILKGLATCDRGGV